MPALENSRQERYAQNLIQGMSQRDAYRDAFPSAAKWKDATVDVRASELASQPEIQDRLQELKDAAANDAIINRQERMIILSDIATDVEMHPKQRMQAIDILNKMDGDYVKRVEATVSGDLTAAAAEVAAILNE